LSGGSNRTQLKNTAANSHKNTARTHKTQSKYHSPNTTNQKTTGAKAPKEKIKIMKKKKSNDENLINVKNKNGDPETENTEDPTQETRSSAGGSGRSGASEPETFDSPPNKQYVSNSLNRAGTGSVDLFKQEVTFVHDDLTLEHPKLPISVSHVYNSAFIGSTEDYAEAYCGENWRTNFHQYIVERPNPGGGYDRYYIDGMGEEQAIISKTNEQNQQIYVLENDTTTVVIGHCGGTTIKDKYGNMLHFPGHSNCWLTGQEDAFQNRIEIERDSTTPGKITKIKEADNADREIIFNYLNDKLISIESEVLHYAPPAGIILGPTLPQTIRQELYFSYTGDYLTQISYDTIPSDDKTAFGYTLTTPKRLNSVTDPTGRILEYQYTIGGVPARIQEKPGRIISGLTGSAAGSVSVSDDDLPIRERDILFNDRDARVSYKAGNADKTYTVYGFDGEGDTTYAYSHTMPNNTDASIRVKPTISFSKKSEGAAGKKYEIHASLDETAHNYAGSQAMKSLNDWTHSGSVSTVLNTGVSEGPCITLSPGGTIERTFNVATGAAKGYVVACFAKGKANLSLKADIDTPLAGTASEPVLNSGEWVFENQTAAWQPGAVVLRGRNDNILQTTQITVTIYCGGGTAYVDGLRIEEAPFTHIQKEGRTTKTTKSNDGSWSESTFDAQERITKQDRFDQFGRDFSTDIGYDNGRVGQVTDHRQSSFSMTSAVDYNPDGTLAGAERYENGVSPQSATASQTLPDEYESQSEPDMHIERPNPGTEIRTDLRSGKLSSVKTACQESVSSHNSGYGETTYNYLFDGGDLAKQELRFEGFKNEYFYTRRLLTRVQSDNNEILYAYDGFNALKSVTLNGKEVKKYESKEDCIYASESEIEDYNFERQTVPVGDPQESGEYTQTTYFNADGVPVRKTEQYDGDSEETVLLEVALDAQGRPETVTDYVDGPKLSFTYHNDGSAHEIKYSGSRRGLITLETSGDKNETRTKTVSFCDGTVEYKYDYLNSAGNDNGNGASRHVPEGSPSTLTITPACGSSQAYEGSLGYDGFGRFSDKYVCLKTSRNLDEKYVYAKANGSETDRVERIEYWHDEYRGSKQLLGETSYTYYDDRRIQSEIGVVLAYSSGYQQYQYDQAGRLCREDNAVLGFTKVYAYGAGAAGGGNLAKVIKYNYNVWTPTAGLATSVIKQSETNYTYGTGTDRLTQLVTIRGSTITENISDYDLAGNPCNYRGTVLEWERGRRLKAFGDIEFTYDAGGVRQEKIFSDGFAHKFYTEGNVIHKEQRGYPTSPDGGARRHATLRYHYDQTGFCGIESSGVVYHVKKNLQGDVVMLVDGRNGKVAAKYVYDAWGNHKIYRTNTRGDNIEIYDSLTGSIASETYIGNLNPFRYRGYYYDADIRLYYLQTRYYDPQVGRFINADAVDYADPESINGLNLYAYCGNDPVNGVDPEGHAPKWLKNLLIGVAIAAAVAVVAVGVAGLIVATGGAATPMLVGAGIGGAMGVVSTIISEVNENGWNDINWGKVAFNGAMGAATGALMASPLGAVATGFAVGGVGFTQSVGNDLFDNKGDWKEVNWGKAVAVGVVSGVVSGAGKGLMNNISGRIAKYSSKFDQAKMPILKVFETVGKMARTGVSATTAGVRSGAKSLINFGFTW